MVKLDDITKDWKEAGSFAAQLNLYGFWDQHSFLTYPNGERSAGIGSDGTSRTFDHNACSGYALTGIIRYFPLQ